MKNVRKMVLASLFASLCGICSWICMPIPPVYITLQTLALLLTLNLSACQRRMEPAAPEEPSQPPAVEEEIDVPSPPEKKPEETINTKDEIMSKDTCYLTDEETKIRNEIIEEKNKAYIEGFGYAVPSKTKTIIVDSDGDINKMVGTME